MTTPTFDQLKQQARIAYYEKVAEIRATQYERVRQLLTTRSESFADLEEAEIALLAAQLDLELAQIDMGALSPAQGEIHG